MPNGSTKHIHISIRLKLVLLSTALLAIPLIGVHYIREMGNYLRLNREEVLLARAETISANLALRSDIFSETQYSGKLVPSGYHLFVRTLSSPIQLDGYLEDWNEYQHRMRTYSDNNRIFQSPQIKPSMSFSHQVGRFGKYLYAVFHVKDDRVVYRHPNSYHLDQSDHLRISMTDKQGKVRSYILTTLAPGWVNAHQIMDDSGQRPVTRPEVSIKGEWQETRDGYVIEIRIPISMVGARLAFAIGDVDDTQERKLVSVISTAGQHSISEMATVIISSPEVDNFLAGYSRPNSRIWLTDRNHRVLGISDRLLESDETTKADQFETQHSILSGLLHLLYSQLLSQPALKFEDDLSSASRLDGAEIAAALNGNPTTGWRQSPDEKIDVLTATYPVRKQGEILGVVAIEETSNRILLTQNRAIEILFNLSILTFLVAMVLLLGFAGRLISRISRLNRQANLAITADGRVTGQIMDTGARDELGELSRNIADMLDRISQYHRYLETMASKLSHEIRTPITVVKSSIENLAPSLDDDNERKYLERASEGLQRLNSILTRMSEATRLEQTLASESKQDFDLAEVLKAAIEAYQIGYPQRHFDLKLPDPDIIACTVSGSPELFLQMLDKLVANAVDFSKPEDEISVSLSRQDDLLRVSVFNPGPSIPDQIRANLFDSMVSSREGRTAEVHLGLGLYIVRMITEFHGGVVSAHNSINPQGVRFDADFPFSANTN